jgi:hypothetical protein
MMAGAMAVRDTMVRPGVLMNNAIRHITVVLDCVLLFFTEAQSASQSSDYHSTLMTGSEPSMAPLYCRTKIR